MQIRAAGWPPFFVRAGAPKPSIDDSKRSIDGSKRRSDGSKTSSGISLPSERLLHLRRRLEPSSFVVCGYVLTNVSDAIPPFLYTSVKYTPPHLRRCFHRRELRMNAKSCLQRTTSEGSASRFANSAIFRGGAGRHASNGLSSVINDVVAGFMDSLRSTGQGALPLVLAIRPERSTENVAESDPDFVRRERRRARPKGVSSRRSSRCFAVRSLRYLPLRLAEIRRRDGEMR
jgi:hypothetical protein